MRSLNPQRIDEHNWWYEEPLSVTLVHEVVDPVTGVHMRTDQIDIPAARLAKSLERMGYAKAIPRLRGRRRKQPQEAPAK